MKSPVPTICALAAAWLFLATPALAQTTSALTESQRQCLAKALRHEKAGWTYLHIEGGPRERGFQHGYLLAKEIAECLRVRRAVWYHNTAMDWDDLLKETARFVTPFVDPENREELAGIRDGLQAAGQTATLDDLVAYNAYMELEWYWWPEVLKKVTGGATVVTPPKQSCSAFIATGSMTRDGGVVLGHNTMLDYVDAYCRVIVDIFPAKGHRILMQSSPGWIHSGTDFFITDAGLVGSETTIGSFHGFSEWGMPEFARMRRATQDAGSIDQWCQIMKKGNNGGLANAWLLGDVNSGEIARLELGLAYVGFERTRDGFFIGSNVAENRKILLRETDMNDADIRNTCIARRVRWKQLMAQHRGEIDPALARQFEADHFDVYAKAERPGGRTLCGHGEIETDYGPGAWAVPYRPSGTLDAKIVDSAMAKRMSFAARWGSACGRAFDADTSMPPHHGCMQFRALQQRTKTSVRFVTFPGAEHSLKRLSHWRRKVDQELAWFDRYLYGTAKEPEPWLKEGSPIAALVARAKAKSEDGRMGVVLNTISRLTGEKWRLPTAAEADQPKEARARQPQAGPDYTGFRVMKEQTPRNTTP